MGPGGGAWHGAGCLEGGFGVSGKRAGLKVPFFDKVDLNPVVDLLKRGTFFGLIREFQHVSGLFSRFGRAHQQAAHTFPLFEPHFMAPQWADFMFRLAN